MRTHHTLTVGLCSAALFLLSCTEARRAGEEKANAKPTPVASNAPPLPTEPPLPSAAVTAKPTPGNALFKGDLAGKMGKEKLYAFLEKYDKKIIALDLLLSDEQLAQINDVEKGRKWYFDLAYPDKEGFNTGGELLIDITKGKGDLKLSGNHLTGNILVTKWAGPHQGLMSINAKPAMGEAASGKKETPEKATSSAPVEGKPKPGGASDPPL